MRELPGHATKRYHPQALPVLEAILGFFDQLAEERHVVCRAGCAVCCTDRVQMTTLEGRYLMQGLEKAGRRDLMVAAAGLMVDPAARPACTPNASARIYGQGGQPPEGGPTRARGTCPLLGDGLCAAYDHRPLMCRAMLSRERCYPGSQAVESDWWVAVVGAFLQLVEGLDSGGGFGLLPEVLCGRRHLLACEPLPGIAAPPDFQNRLDKTLRQLFSQTMQQQPLGYWFDLVVKG